MISNRDFTYTRDKQQLNENSSFCNHSNEC